MLGWIWRLLVGRFSRCEHQWETVDVRDVLDKTDGGEDRYKRYILRCQNCGDVCKRDLG